MPQRGEVLARSLDPQRVGVEHEKRALAEERQRTLYAAARLQKPLTLVRDDDLRRPAACNVRLHQVGKMVDVDHRGSHVCGGQTVERVVDQRSSADLDERLRKGGRDRAHALAETGGEHHGGVKMGRTIFAHRRGTA